MSRRIKSEFVPATAADRAQALNEALGLVEEVIIALNSSRKTAVLAVAREKLFEAHSKVFHVAENLEFDAAYGERGSR